jgi:hypothetical protein
MTLCPNDEDLVRYVDQALSLERTSELQGHIALCPVCREHEEALRRLIEDLKAPAPLDLDVRVHAQRVMERIERPERSAVVSSTPRRAWHWVAVGSAAACVLLLVTLRLGTRALPAETLQARGAAVPASLERDVAVRPCRVEGGLRPLASGAAIDPNTPLTATFRNLRSTPVFLLLFAVDARRAVHWISPPFTRPEDDPASTALPTAAGERTLDTTAVLDDLPPGPLRVVAVVTSTPAHVSDVESLEGSDLSATRLEARFPGAEVRETPVTVHPFDGALP